MHNLKSVTRPAQRGTIAVAQIISQVHQRQGHSRHASGGRQGMGAVGPDRGRSTRSLSLGQVDDVISLVIINAFHLPSETGVSEPS